MHPEADWKVITLCRANDPDRSPKFYKALEELGATGVMGDLDDEPQQQPQDSRHIQELITKLLPSDIFNLVITHGIRSEYTHHRRHEETGEAVMSLWLREKISAKQVWRFAYEDGNGNYLPRAVNDADLNTRLNDVIWKKKYHIITNIYGFAPDSFEARTTPRREAFWCFGKP